MLSSISNKNSLDSMSIQSKQLSKTINYVTVLLTWCLLAHKTEVVNPEVRGHLDEVNVKQKKMLFFMSSDIYPSVMFFFFF